MFCKIKVVVFAFKSLYSSVKPIHNDKIRYTLVADNLLVKFQLKDEVTSPGGSTIVGIHSLEKNAVRGSLMSAIEAAFLRNKEMNPKANK